MKKLLATTFILSCVFAFRPTGAIAGTETRVSDGNGYAVFSTYGTSPENPSGTKLAYTAFPTVPTSNNAEFSAEVWIKDLSNQTSSKLTDVSRINAHNGARVDWISDDKLLFWDNRDTVVMNLNGQELYRLVGYFPGEKTYGSKILAFDKDYFDSSSGVWILDTANGAFSKVVDHYDFQQFAIDMGVTSQPDTWGLSHARFNNNGNLVGLVVNPPDAMAHFFSVRLSDNSITFFGIKPLHWLWSGNTSIIGHDPTPGTNQKYMCKRYHLDGTVIETIAHKGNHLGFYFGSKVASENRTNSNPVVLRLYDWKQDITQGSGDVIFSSIYSSAIWSNGRAHVNPSFSRDGTRVYYNKPMGPNLVQAFQYEE